MVTIRPEFSGTILKTKLMSQTIFVQYLITVSIFPISFRLHNNVYDLNCYLSVVTAPEPAKAKMITLPTLLLTLVQFQTSSTTRASDSF